MTEIAEPPEEIGRMEFYLAGEEGWRSTCLPELGAMTVSGALGFTIYVGLENQVTSSADVAATSSGSPETEAGVAVQPQPTILNEVIPEATGAVGFLYLSLCSLFVIRSVRRSQASSERIQRSAREAIKTIQATTEPTIS